MAKSVFYDIAETPEEATNLTARSLLMIAIEQRIRENGWTQAKAARALGVQQPRISDLMNGKVDKFSLDALVNMLPTVGLTFSVERVQPVARLVGLEPPARSRTRTPARRSGPRPAVAATAGAGKVAAVAKANRTLSGRKSGGVVKSRAGGALGSGKKQK